MRPVVGFADLVRAVAVTGAVETREAGAVAALLGLASPLTAVSPSEPARTDTEPPAHEPRERRAERTRRTDRERRRSRRVEPSVRASPGETDATLSTGDELSVERLPTRALGGDAAALAPVPFNPSGTRIPLEHHPLIDPRLARAAISQLLARNADSGAIDLDAAIEAIARARPLIAMPQRQEPTLRFGVQVLIDVGDGMLPFSADAVDLERRIRTVVGEDRLQVRYFRDHPATVRGEGLDGWRVYTPPAPGTPVLAVSDLAIARGGMPRDVERGWSGVAAVLSRAGCSLRVLIPFRAPSPLPGIAVVPWERPPPAGTRAAPVATLELADDVLAGLAAALPEVHALARMVALTARCEPALLRRLRRRFLPAADAGDEALLWASPLIEARGIGGIRLRPEAARALLATWQGDPALAEVVAAITDAHRGAPSVVRWQEELAAYAVRSSPDDLQCIDELLAGVAAAIATGTPAAAAQLSSWTAHALPRLPDDVRRRPTAVQLAALGSLRAGGAAAISVRLPIGSMAPARVETAIALAAAAEPQPSIAEVIGERASATCRVTIRRAAGKAELRRLGSDVERQPGQVEVEVPDTRPVLLEVRTGEDAAVVALGGEPVELDWRSGPLDLYGVDGAGYRVRPIDAAQRLESPWTSLAWIDDGSELCRGYVVDPRGVVLAAGSREWSGVEPVKVCVGGVVHEARTAAIDRDHGLVALVLDREAADPPLAEALRATREIQRGVMALRPRGLTHHLLELAAFEPPMCAASSTLAECGMPVVYAGELQGLLGARLNRGEPTSRGESAGPRGTLTYDIFAYTLIEARDVAGVFGRAQADIDRLLALASELGSLSAAAWQDRYRGVRSLYDPPLQLADAILDGLARREPMVRAAALLWWETAPSSTALPHVLDALAPGAAPGEQLAAIRCARAALKYLTGGIARALAARIDDLRSTLVRGNAVLNEAAELRGMLSAMISPHSHSALPPFEDPKHLDDMALAPVVDLVRSARGGVFVITGGNGATRLGLIARLIRLSGVDEHPYVACAFEPERASLDTLCTAAAPFAATGSPNAALAAMAGVGACVVLEGLRWLWDDEVEAAAACTALLAGFAAVGRGRCLVTWPSLTSAPKLGETGRTISLDTLPVGTAFRDLLGTALRRKAWLDDVMQFSPVSAICALLDLVEVRVARALDAGDAAIRAREAVLSWRERPWRPPGGEHELERAFGKLGTLAFSALLVARNWLLSAVPGQDPKRIEQALMRPARQLSEAIESQIGMTEVRNGIRRIYLGTGYAPEGTRRWVIAFCTLSSEMSSALMRRLVEIARGAINLELEHDPRHTADGRLVCSALSPIFLRVLDAWRGGSLLRSDGLELRWLAELRPLPDPHDPQKAHFGGLPERNGRIATASIIALREDWFQVKVEVKATLGAKPLRGKVRFRLHDSFPSDVVDVAVLDERATFVMSAWGAFTIGIECDKGKTRLELDLALQPGIPTAFIDEDHDREPWLEVASYGVDLPLHLGTRWEYVRADATRPRQRSAWRPRTMRVAELIESADGTHAARISGFVLGEALDLGRDAWLIRPVEGEYHIAFPDALRGSQTLAREIKVAELLRASNAALRLPTYAGARFAGPGWIMTVEDVRYDTLRVVGARKRTAIYRIRYDEGHRVAVFEVAPTVGILNVIPQGGKYAWYLRELVVGKKLQRTSLARQLSLSLTTKPASDRTTKKRSNSKSGKSIKTTRQAKK